MQLGLKHCQGWGIYKFSAQSVLVSHQPHDSSTWYHCLWMWSSILSFSSNSTSVNHIPCQFYGQNVVRGRAKGLTEVCIDPELLFPCPTGTVIVRKLVLAAFPLQCDHVCLQLSPCHHLSCYIFQEDLFLNFTGHGSQTDGPVHDVYFFLVTGFT